MKESGLLEPQTEETVVLILDRHLDIRAFQLRQQGCGTLQLGLLEAVIVYILNLRMAEGPSGVLSKCFVVDVLSGSVLIEMFF